MILSRFGGDTGGYKGPERERQTEKCSFLRSVYNRRA